MSLFCLALLALSVLLAIAVKTNRHSIVKLCKVPVDFIKQQYGKLVRLLGKLIKQVKEPDEVTCQNCGILHGPNEQHECPAILTTHMSNINLDQRLNREVPVDVEVAKRKSLESVVTKSTDQ